MEVVYTFAAAASGTASVVVLNVGCGYPEYRPPPPKVTKLGTSLMIRATPRWRISMGVSMPSPEGGHIACATGGAWCRLWTKVADVLYVVELRATTDSGVERFCMGDQRSGGASTREGRTPKKAAPRLRAIFKSPAGFCGG